MKAFQILFVVVFTIFHSECEPSQRLNKKPCVPENFGYSSIVCVCNETYCDELEPFEPIATRQYLQIVSSLDGQRFEVFDGDSDMEWTEIVEEGQESLVCTDSSNVAQLLVIHRSVKYQNINGFGGAFTDSASINYASVSKQLQARILSSYFGQNGLNYNFGRVPIAGTDFSTRQYSYDDIDNDTSLDHFALSVEDVQYKIPFIRQALGLNPNLKLLTAAWSAPKWMKTNHKFNGYGFLKLEYYQLWADYLVRFLHEYQIHNFSTWGISTQNEPFDGQIPEFPFNCMGWTAEQQRDWIKHNLGPTLVKSGFGSVKVIILDDQRSFLNSWVRTILSDPDAAKYVSGIGLHWYFDFYPPSILDIAHEDFPNHFLLATEACVGSDPGEHQVMLGSWERGEAYAQSIIQDLNHWITGWIDWNLILDLNGGPSWAENYVDAPIIVDSITDKAYKQPLYYALGHFSKYIPEHSVRIHHELTTTTLDRDGNGSNSNITLHGFEILTVERPDGYIAIVVLNKLNRMISLKIRDVKSDSFIRIDCEPRSIRTIICNL